MMAQYKETLSWLRLFVRNFRKALLGNTPCVLAVVCIGNFGTAIADSPIIQTPSPIIYLADNLNEPDGLGWCIDTVGRGFAEKLHAHSCKPQGGDVQFSYSAENQFIYSVEFDGKCMSIGGDAMSAEFDLLDCDVTAPEQKFEFDIDTGFITPISKPELCVAVSESIRSAGPFSSRDLMLANCKSFSATHLRWVIK